MTVAFRDVDGTTRLAGELLASGGATGDVLMQQADGTFQPAAGGSLPDPIAQQVNIAQPDTGEASLVLTCPVGTWNDGDEALVVNDEAGDKIFTVDADGRVDITSSTGQDSARLQITGDTTGGGGGAIALRATQAAEDTGVTISPPLNGDAQLVINGGGLGPGHQIKNTGVGFFGVAAVTQPNVPLTTPDVQDVIDALVALGLVEQSD